MIIAHITIAILMLMFPPIKIANKKMGLVIHDDYLSKESTLTIKGSFVLLVFFSHFNQYVILSNSILDSLFIRITNVLGQLIVVMFFFYSGYGIFESFKKKDYEYVNRFLTHKLLPLWISFSICICFFLIENSILGNKYSIQDIVLSFTGWSSIGNSNWFMFVTFVLYIMFFIVFSIFKNFNNYFKLIVLSLASVLVLIPILVVFKESYWYNTLLCFVAGMWFSFFKEKIDLFLGKSNFNFYLTSFLIFISLLMNYFISRSYEMFYSAFSINFALSIILITMKFKFSSIPMIFLGKHVFSIYILQRLVFSALVIARISNNYLLFVFSLAITVVISFIYDTFFAYGKSKFIIFRNRLKATKRV